MKRLVDKLQSFWRIPRHRKILFFKVIGLSIYRGILFYRASPEAHSEKIIQQFPGNKVSNQKLEEAMDIAFAVGLGAKYIPWPNLCRHQSWQSIYLLNQKEIPYRYNVGVKRENREVGHSWILVGDKFVCGSCQISEYTLLRAY